MKYSIQSNDVFEKDITLTMKVGELLAIVLGFGECTIGDYENICKRNGISFDSEKLDNELHNILRDCGVVVND